MAIQWNKYFFVNFIHKNPVFSLWNFVIHAAVPS